MLQLEGDKAYSKVGGGGFQDPQFSQSKALGPNKEGHKWARISDIVKKTGAGAIAVFD